MKKFSLLISIILIACTLGGCYFFRKAEAMKVESITVYDSQGNEVVGEYLDYYEQMSKLEPSSATGMMLLNSPAPEVLYLFVPAQKGESYQVVIKFVARNSSYQMKSLNTYFNSQERDSLLTDDVTAEGNIYTAKLNIDVDEQHNTLTIHKWYNTNDEYNSFAGRGGATYIRGVCFRITD